MFFVNKKNFGTVSFAAITLYFSLRYIIRNIYFQYCVKLVFEATITQCLLSLLRQLIIAAKMMLTKFTDALNHKRKSYHAIKLRRVNLSFYTWWEPFNLISRVDHCGPEWTIPGASDRYLASFFKVEVIEFPRMSVDVYSQKKLV